MNIFSYWHFHNASKEYFWSKKFSNFIHRFKMPIKKNIYNMAQGPPNPGFMQEKVQKGDFLKKPSRELKFLLLF